MRSIRPEKKQKRRLNEHVTQVSNLRGQVRDLSYVARVSNLRGQVRDLSYVARVSNLRGQVRDLSYVARVSNLCGQVRELSYVARVSNLRGQVRELSYVMRVSNLCGQVRELSYVARVSNLRGQVRDLSYVVRVSNLRGQVRDLSYVVQVSNLCGQVRDLSYGANESVTIRPCMDKKPRFLHSLALLLLFGLGLAIRLYDLTDLPLDFHPTRQLFSAVKARGMYYQTRWDLPNWQRTLAIQQWKSKVTVEPEIMEHLAAFTYRYLGEQLWLPRLYSALFWLAGGVFLYLLARRLASTGGAFRQARCGALLAVAFYLFTPYAVFASRSFQPDPLMVMLLLAFWWLIDRWAASPSVSRFPFHISPSWLFAILAALVGGLAIYVKLTAAFFVIGGALGAALARRHLRDLLRDPQVWVMAALGALPGLSWALTSGLASNYLGEEVNSRFVPALLVSPSFYLQWQNKITMVTGSLGVALALLGLFFFREGRARIFLAGLWLSYLLFGLYFDYHISTHDYYSLPLIPIAALSLAAMGERFCDWAAQNASETEAGRGWVWKRGAFRQAWYGALVAVLLYGLFSVVWSIRNEMKAVNYRPQAACWQEIGAALGREASVIALSQDYGLRLAYWGWQEAAVWPSSGDVYRAQVVGGGRDFEAFFEKMAGKKRFFLVTDMDDFARQPELQSLLADYPVYAQGEGFSDCQRYVIYDLQPALEARP